MDKTPSSTIPRQTRPMVKPTPLRTPVVNSENVNTEEEENMTKKSQAKWRVLYAIVIGIGIASGYWLSRPASNSAQSGTAVFQESASGKAYGVDDTSTFKDTAIGTVELGGIDGEGTHHLLRDGGPSQTVYLVSSVVNLDELQGKKVKVWGQTMSARKAAWLMDVGRVEEQN